MYLLKIFFLSFLYPKINFTLLNKFNFLLKRKFFIEHHPVFNFLNIKPSRISKKYIYDFIGSKSFFSYTGKDFLNTKLGEVDIDNEYFEWISILLSVYQASKKFNFYEVGAGYGRWGVRAHHACVLLNIKNINIKFFEAEPNHIKYLKRHIQLNGLENNDYKIYDGILDEEEGKKFFYVKAPKEFGDSSSLNWYGQSVIKDYENNPKKLDQKYHGHDLFIFPSGWQAIKLKTLDFRAILSKDKSIDLIDFDIQGDEHKLIYKNIDILNINTKRLHISTHSPQIHKKIKVLLAINGWLKVYDYGEHKVNKTPFGSINFSDGLLVFINPRINQYYG